MRRASPWPPADPKGDTVWMGAIDRNGLAVSFIQSIYFEFGSGVVLPRTGIALAEPRRRLLARPELAPALAPGRKPFHTLNPPLARFKDGRTMTYGSMGGDGQPQFQAAIFTRYACFGDGAGRRHRPAALALGPDLGRRPASPASKWRTASTPTWSPR